jgi:hypothetical protein
MKRGFPIVAHLSGRLFFSLGLETMKYSCYIILLFAFFVLPSQVKGNNQSESEEEIAEEMLTYMVSNNCKHYDREKIYVIVLKNIDYSDKFLKKIEHLQIQHEMHNSFKEASCLRNGNYTGISIVIKEINENFAIAHGACVHLSQGFGNFASYELKKRNNLWTIIKIFNEGEGD